MRSRNAAETRAAILQAARAAFTLKGFDQVGIREITGAVGVNGSLVSRYFGSKEGLFAEVMKERAGAEGLSAQTFDQALSSLTDRAMRPHAGPSNFDPVLAFIRSAPIERAHPILRDYLDREAVGPLADLIGGDDAHERASLIMAFIVGVTLLRAVVKSDPLASTKRNDLSELIECIMRVVGRRETCTST